MVKSKSKTEKTPRPRRFSIEFKEAAVRRMANESPAALARELGVVRKLLYDWQRQVKQGQTLKLTGRPRQPVGAADSVPVAAVATCLEQIAELEQLVGRQQRELAFFRGAWRRVAAWTPASNDAGATPSLPKSGT